MPKRNFQKIRLLDWTKKQSALALCFCLFACSTMLGCYPYEPGSDLMDVANSPLIAEPEPDLSIPKDIMAEEDTDITGSFLAKSLLMPPVGRYIEAEYLFGSVQMGKIPDGMATVTLDVRDPMMPEMKGPSFEEPAKIDEKGAFSGKIVGMVIPKDFAPTFLAEDADATMQVDGQILTNDCFVGDIVVTLVQAKLLFNPEQPMDLVLNGTFKAGREGTSGCTDPMDMDMGMSTDMTLDMGAGD